MDEEKEKFYDKFLSELCRERRPKKTIELRLMPEQAKRLYDTADDEMKYVLKILSPDGLYDNCGKSTE